MLYKIHKSYRDTVAICDKELIGKVFEEDENQLEVKESFYKGEEISEEKASELMKDMIKEDATFNIVGEKSVQIALDSGIIVKEGIKKIQGVPFAMILM